MTSLARTEKINFRIDGIAASAGIVIAEVYLLDRRRVDVEEWSISPAAIDDEIAKFNDAVALAREQLRQVRNSIEKDDSEEHSLIIDTQLMILDDQMLLDGTTNLVRSACINASGALRRVLQGFRRNFEAVDDEYLRERGSDIEMVGERILRNLRGSVQQSTADLRSQAVVVAHDLSPADTLQMDRSKVVAFVTDLGGRTSHTAILARSLGIPAVVGLENITALVAGGERIIVDGCSGSVVVNPCAHTIKHYEEKRQRYLRYRQQLQSYCQLPAQTLDGRKITIKANIEFPEEAELAINNGAEGIGLLRTEFMYMARQTPPDEEIQFQEFKRIIEQVTPHPVTIRTLDMGGDKFVSDICLGDEPNPAMGLRSIRLSLREQQLFRTQLRAILRASALGEVRILLPMISGVAEVRSCRAIISQVIEELRGEGVACDSEIAIGIMVETPSAVLLCDVFAREVDFFSVGSNDLIQYCLAIDRGNEHVAYLYEPLHPAILRALTMVAEAAQREGIPACICGEMAAEPIYAMLLLAMGYSELSMNSGGISQVKKLLGQWHSENGRELLTKILALTTADEVKECVERQMKIYLPDVEVGWEFV